MTNQASEPLVSHLQTLREQLITTLQAIDFVLANNAGGDLVIWAGQAQHEQRCGRCQYWIFSDEKIAAVITTPPDSMYIHRKCIIRLPDQQNGSNT